MLLPLGLLCASSALGAGFAIDTQSARATGMATAVTALVDDGSAVFYNPAGLAGHPGFFAQAGVSLIIPSITFTNESNVQTSAVTQVVPPPHLYAAFGVTDKLTFGLGFLTPYGASSVWPEGWEGRFRALRSTLQVFLLNPSVAYQIHDRFRVGAGAQIYRGTVVLERALGFVDSEGKVRLGGDAWGAGYNVGAQFDLVPEWVVLGGTYRSGAKLPFKGRAHFSDIPSEFASRIYDNGVATDLRLPDSASFGVAFTRPRFRLAAEVHYMGWASFQELRLDFENDALDSALPKSWNDVLSVHVGGELDVTSAIRVRAGYAYDPSPQPAETLTPDIADMSRNKISVGVGYTYGDFSADLAWQLVLLTATKSTAPTFPGTYGGNAHVIGLTLGYSP